MTDFSHLYAHFKISNDLKNTVCEHSMASFNEKLKNVPYMIETHMISDDIDEVTKEGCIYAKLVATSK